jgi:hypothetical protein
MMQITLEIHCKSISANITWSRCGLQYEYLLYFSKLSLKTDPVAYGPRNTVNTLDLGNINDFSSHHVVILEALVSRSHYDFLSVRAEVCGVDRISVNKHALDLGILLTINLQPKKMSITLDATIYHFVILQIKF